MYSFTVRSIDKAPLWPSDFPDFSAPLFVSLCDDLPGFSAGAFANHAGSRYSSIPSRPPSRPYPLSRYPPNPHAASNKFVLFTPTPPAFTCAETCSATFTLSLQTLAASPYVVLFANSTASRRVRNVIAASTGPKISCCATVDAGCTLLSSVGGKYSPRPGNVKPSGCQHVAPSALPCFTNRSIRSNCTRATIAPTSTALSSGAPTRSVLIRRRTLSSSASDTLSCTSNREPAQQTCP